MLEFTKYLNGELVLDVPAVTNRQELFEFVAQELKRKGVIKDSELIVHALLEREHAGPTSVGHAIALPHVILETLDRILLVVVRLAQPLDWEALDREPVQVAFFILAPPFEQAEYIRVLGSLATRLHRKGIVKNILEAKSKTAVISAILYPTKEKFLYRYRRYIYFGAVVVINFLLFNYLFPKIVLPTSDYFTQLDYLKFNHQPWLFR